MAMPLLDNTAGVRREKSEGGGSALGRAVHCSSGCEREQEERCLLAHTQLMDWTAPDKLHNLASSESHLQAANDGQEITSNVHSINAAAERLA